MTDIKNNFEYLRDIIYSNEIPHEMYLFMIENTNNPEMITGLLRRIGEIYEVLRRKYDQIMIDNTLDSGISAFISKNLNEKELLDRIRLDSIEHYSIRIGDEYYVCHKNGAQQDIVKSFYYNTNSGYLELSQPPFQILNN